MPPIPAIVTNPSDPAPSGPIPGESNDPFNVGWMGVEAAIRNEVAKCAELELGAEMEPLGSGDEQISDEGWWQFYDEITKAVMVALNERLKGWLWENWKSRGRRLITPPVGVRIVSPPDHGGH